MCRNFDQSHRFDEVIDLYYKLRFHSDLVKKLNLLYSLNQIYYTFITLVVLPQSVQ